MDTGFTDDVPEGAPEKDALGFMGYVISDYITAFKALGYEPEQVTRILLTHRHSDHSGSLHLFPNAKIHVNAEELGAEELQGIGNLAPVSFTDGAYYNFPESQRIRDGIYFIRAKGHTNGNSIVIVEQDGLFFMLHGDISYTVLKLKAPFRYRAQSLGIAAFSSEYKVLFDTFSFKKKYYVDEALYENKLSFLLENSIKREHDRRRLPPAVTLPFFKQALFFPGYARKPCWRIPSADRTHSAAPLRTP